MRFLANENVSATVVQGLRARGHDVTWACEGLRGAADAAILACAQSEQRIVLTHDKDFGELAFRLGLPANCGIVLLRLAGNGPQADNRRALEALDSRDDWVGHFAVITDDRLRMRPLV